MVATFRCNEIKNESMKLVQEDLVKLTQECERSIVSNFRDRSMDILKIANNHYDNESH